MATNEKDTRPPEGSKWWRVLYANLGKEEHHGRFVWENDGPPGGFNTPPGQFCERVQDPAEAPKDDPAADALRAFRAKAQADINAARAEVDRLDAAMAALAGRVTTSAAKPPGYGAFPSEGAASPEEPRNPRDVPRPGDTWKDSLGDVFCLLPNGRTRWAVLAGRNYSPDGVSFTAEEIFREVPNATYLGVMSWADAQDAGGWPWASGSTS